MRPAILTSSFAACHKDPTAPDVEASRNSFAALPYEKADRRLDQPSRQPGYLGSFETNERRGGGEDPWLCVPDFDQVCLYKLEKCVKRRISVNSGMYLECPLRIINKRSIPKLAVPPGSLRMVLKKREAVDGFLEGLLAPMTGCFGLMASVAILTPVSSTPERNLRPEAGDRIREDFRHTAHRISVTRDLQVLRLTSSSYSIQSADEQT